MISVVIPLYNKANYISRAIDSVLAQTMSPHEVIVVDDGSTDGGSKVVDRYAKQGIRLIQQSNCGVSGARNAGVQASSSEYVAFLDADDEWQKNHIHVLSDLISRYPDAALYSTAHLIYRENRLHRPRSPFAEGWCGYVTNFFSAYARGLSLVNSTTACVSKSKLLAAGGFPTGVKRGEDVITWCKLAMIAPVAHAETVTAIYHQDIHDRRARPAETDAPGSLYFLSQLLLDKKTPDQLVPGLEKLFDQIALFTSAGFIVDGWRDGAASIRRLAWESGRYQIAIMIAALGMVPPNILKVLRKHRHRQIENCVGG